MKYIVKFIGIRILVGCALTCVAVIISFATSDWEIVFRWCSFIGLGLVVVGVSPLYPKAQGRFFMTGRSSKERIADEKERFDNNLRWALSTVTVGVTMFLAPILVYIFHPTA